MQYHLVIHFKDQPSAQKDKRNCQDRQQESVIHKMSHASVSLQEFLKQEPPAPGSNAASLTGKANSYFSRVWGGKKAKRKKFCQKLQQQSCETRKEVQQILQSESPAEGCWFQQN